MTPHAFVYFWGVFPCTVDSFINVYYCFLIYFFAGLRSPTKCRRAEDGQAISVEATDGENTRERAVEGYESGDVGCVKMGGRCLLFAAYPSVPFLLGVLVLITVPSGFWPSLRGGILSFILSSPRASSKLRIFLVGEKPWIANGQERDQREGA